MVTLISTPVTSRQASTNSLTELPLPVPTLYNTAPPTQIAAAPSSVDNRPSRNHEGGSASDGPATCHDAIRQLGRSRALGPQTQPPDLGRMRIDCGGCALIGQDRRAYQENNRPARYRQNKTTFSSIVDLAPPLTWGVVEDSRHRHVRVHEVGDVDVVAHARSAEVTNIPWSHLELLYGQLLQTLSTVQEYTSTQPPAPLRAGSIVRPKWGLFRSFERERPEAALRWLTQRNPVMCRCRPGLA